MYIVGYYWFRRLFLWLYRWSGMKSMQHGARLAYSSTQWLNIVASTSRMLFICTVSVYNVWNSRWHCHHVTSCPVVSLIRSSVFVRFLMLKPASSCWNLFHFSVSCLNLGRFVTGTGYYPWEATQRSLTTRTHMSCKIIIHFVTHHSHMSFTAMNILKLPAQLFDAACYDYYLKGGTRRICFY